MSDILESDGEHSFISFMASCSTASPKAQPAGFPWEQAHLVAAEPSQLLHKKSHI